MKEILKKDIKNLGIAKNLINILYDNEIKLVYELCLLNRKKLKEYGFKSTDINDIIVKLQLQGLDLGKKYKIK